MKFEIRNIIKHDDNTCELKVFYDKEFEDVVAKYYNKKRVSHKDVQDFIFKAVSSITSV